MFSVYQENIDVEYNIKLKGNGVYLFVIEGLIDIDGQTLGRRDAAGLWETETIKFKAKKDSFILLLDIPMKW